MSIMESSRVIVKNVPAYLTEERLRQHFGVKGEVTDVRLARTESGQSRRFGFVGFRTPKDAKAAVAYFNNTFIDTAHVTVDLARPIGDSSLPRPWSKHSKGSSAHSIKEKKNEAAAQLQEQKQRLRTQVLEERKKKEELLAKLYKSGPAVTEQDSKLDEFLSVMAPRTQKAVWENDDPVTKKAAAAKIVLVKSKRTGGEGVYHTKTHITFEDDDEDEDDEETSEYQVIPTLTPVEVDDRDKNEHRESVTPTSDLEYLRARMTFRDDTDDESRSMAIHKRNIVAPSACDSDDGSTEAGPVSDGDGEDESKREAADEEDTEDALYQELLKATANAPSDGTDQAQGKVPSNAITVGRGRSKRLIIPDVPTESVAESGRLFVRNIPFSCTEEELTIPFKKFGPLSEVHIPIDKETKQGKGYAYILYLIPEHATHALAAMDGSVFQGRLLHVLPANAKPSEQPPPNAAALQVTSTPQSFKAQREAKRKTEANSVFNWNTLFMSSDAVAAAMASKLNVSKGELLDTETTGGEGASMAVRLALAETNIINETKTYLRQHGVVLDVLERSLELGEATKVERSKTIIMVKNISYQTTAKELRSLFGTHGDLVRVVVPPTHTIALVEFSQPSEARSAFRHLAYSRFKHLPLYLEWAPVGVFVSAGSDAPVSMDDNEVDEPTAHAVPHSVPKPAPEPVNLGGRGHIIVGSRAKESKAKNGDGADTIKRTKLLVRNVPFEATVREVRELFKPFGELKTVRLPKKMDGSHRGFAFVEYISHEDARMALKTLINTHLYGRHLVLEWAKQDETTVEALREKTAAQFKSSHLDGHTRKRARTTLYKDEYDLDVGDTEEDQDD